MAVALARSKEPLDAWDLPVLYIFAQFLLVMFNDRSLRALEQAGGPKDSDAFDQQCTRMAVQPPPDGK